MADDGRNFSLTERHRHFIDTQVQTGRHASSSEVVREALRRYEKDVEAEKADTDALWALAEKSEAGEPRGDFIDIQDQARLSAVMGDLLARSKTQAQRSD